MIQQELDFRNSVNAVEAASSSNGASLADTANSKQELSPPAVFKEVSFPKVHIHGRLDYSLWLTAVI